MNKGNNSSGYFKGISVAIGSVVGAAVILPLILMGYNHFFISKNNAGPILKAYEANSVNIVIKMPPRVPGNIPQTLANDYKYPLTQHSHITLKMASNGYGRSANQDAELEYRTFYDTTHQKYFSVIMFDLAYPHLMNMFNYTFWLTSCSKKVYIRVNNDDLHNPAYGTKLNPVPVFKVWGADSALTDIGIYTIPKTGHTDRGKFNYDINDAQYQHNVSTYLTYYLSKKDFKARFVAK